MGKKMVEQEELALFIAAYEEVTGERLVELSAGERPDFICARPTGERVGVELSRPQQDYELARWDRILGITHWHDDWDLWDAGQGIVAQKAIKRAEADWHLADNAMLVVNLVDRAFHSLRWFREECLADDFADAGFAEIWMADYTYLEAYRTVRLIGLYPKRIWGPHRQPSLLQKPYG